MAALTANMNFANRVLPICAVQCVTKLSSKLPRVLATDMCTDQEMGDSLEHCVMLNCTIREALTTKDITESICNRQFRNRTNVVSITAIVGVSLALLAVMLRFLSRMKSRKPGMDDLTMIIAMGFVIPLSVLAIILANHGLGKDIWSVPPANITHILYIFYISEILYLGSSVMIRVSVLCLYLRIFSQGLSRRITHVATVGNLLYGTAFITAAIFQCIPVHAAWTRWDGTVPAKCVNANAVGWTSAAINIILDAVTVMLPLPQLTRLVMSWEQKIHILIMFCLGFLVTIGSILRLTSLVKFATTHNITWDYVPVGYWSSIEVHVSVICACLPTLPSLFRRKAAGARQDDLALQPEPSSHKTKNSHSDDLPLLKLVNIDEHKGVV
ncbi:related to integral membrane protein PTH11 [Rhynchosporium secalis]|uniref:Related to integral membrane protein PTH11 n=1 Tax=Rhynchosporium secalis TaxID=38038 RepID=A0A1E1MWQ4_RHYSE|nr:related to integral membrane protein PTH11 [Rhynchosporium secalis]